MLYLHPHIQSAIRYEWYDVLLDRFYSIEHCADLPLNDIHQDIARRITFGWGFAIWLGINALLWVLLILPNLPDAAAIAVAVAMVPLSLLGGALIGAGYLTIPLMAAARRAAETENPPKIAPESGDPHE